MIRTVANYPGGPYSPGQEQRLKAQYIGFTDFDEWKAFCIESESTVPGFPDVVVFQTKVNHCPTYDLIEFKVSDAKGVITFQKSQPIFYKKHPGLKLSILAWDVPGNRLVRISPDEIIAAKTLRFKIPKAGMKQT